MQIQTYCCLRKSKGGSKKNELSQKQIRSRSTNARRCRITGSTLHTTRPMGNRVDKKQDIVCPEFSRLQDSAGLSNQYIYSFYNNQSPSSDGFEHYPPLSWSAIFWLLMKALTLRRVNSSQNLIPPALELAGTNKNYRFSLASSTANLRTFWKYPMITLYGSSTVPIVPEDNPFKTS